MNLAEIKIYRMIHIGNIPHILKNGITHRNSQNKNSNFITIGDLSLIDTRTKKQVIVDNGDVPTSNPFIIVLGDFIPFYFGIKMPMLYVMQNGGNFVQRATIPENIVYVVCPIIRVIQLNIECYFSDGHATDSLTTFYDMSKINDLPTIIDWDAVRAAYWGGQENLNVKRKKQAEFLVSQDLPANLIEGFGCYNEMAKKTLMDMGIQGRQIKIIPNAYF